MRVKALVTLSVAAWLLAGCGGKGEVYPLPVSKVESRLRALNLPAEMGFGTASGSDATLESVSDKGVTWRISDGGATLGWLEADLEAVDLEHTRVEVDFRVADDIDTERAGKQKLIATVGRLALTEAIDAELDGRAYDRGRLKAQIAAYALTHRDEVANWDFAGDEVSDRMREQRVSSIVAKDPQAGVRLREYETQETMKAAAEPSLKLGEDRYRY